MSRRPPHGALAHRAPILPERVRTIGADSFAFVPHRFLRHGFFAALAPDELRLYFLLVLAADRYGVSFYHYDSICSLLQCPLETYLTARNGLIAKDLIAFDGTRFQVLSLPERPVFDPRPPLTTRHDLEDHDPATIRSHLLHALGHIDAPHRDPKPRR
jgi:hypothetical protein